MAFTGHNLRQSIRKTTYGLQIAFQGTYIDYNSNALKLKNRGNLSFSLKNLSFFRKPEFFLDLSFSKSGQKKKPGTTVRRIQKMGGGNRLAHKSSTKYETKEIW